LERLEVSSCNKTTADGSKKIVLCTAFYAATVWGYCCSIVVGWIVHETVKTGKSHFNYWSLKYNLGYFMA